MYRTEYEANVGGFISMARCRTRSTRAKVPPMVGPKFVALIAACTIAAFLFVSLMQ